MKRTLIVLASLALAACAASPGQSPEVAKIQAACNADAVIRPSVSALLDVPGLATLEQKGAVMAARAVIDPICRDPSAPLQATAAQSLAAATAQVLAVYMELRTRRAGGS
jgi:hypothetical protein